MKPSKIEMKRTTVLQVHQLLIIIIAWTFLGLLIAIYDHIVLQVYGAHERIDNYSFLVSLIRNMGAGFIGALIGGSVLVFYVNVKYQNKPYGHILLFVFFVFISVVAFVTLVMGIIFVPIRTGKPILDTVSLEALKSFALDGHPLKSVVFWSFIVELTQLMLQISNKFGPENFWNIVRGKYNIPKEEERIVMFLDINSSTSIAEHLGDKHYHQLLKDFFADITNPILNNNGSIYQYVGDEVVVSWSCEKGWKSDRCIKCFFDIKAMIESRREFYLTKYGIIPEFKAGIHGGKVVAGEVGIIKRDITFSGDVLNTTSRILSKCKEFKAELLASSSLMDQLKSSLRYESKSLGSIQLTGKSKTVSLYAIYSDIKS